ncbi:VPGUxxT family thioredoxin-like (seleno)protein, type 2 [Flagellimonas sp.]|uniref:VPGUxxT family thioredoxin-like (seleno)protein, type 2 n=1 Tax=Flagellimonas sp. TaxID=2058762 RepID=UPI003F49CFBD
MIWTTKAQTDFSAKSEELGKVHWYRNYDRAVAESKKTNKDILILFQEVPGCATCRNYGQNVLSHPLMVEAIETSFVPLAIFNNKGGHDAEILKRYKEPSWNNPVVRIVDSKGRNLVRRIAGDYSAATLLQRMTEALASRGELTPGYMELLKQELSAKKGGSLREKHFQMYCFWTGEKQLGKIEGVLETESGFMNHGEVVKVTYDANIVDESQLEAYAKRHSFRPVDPNKTYRVASRDVHYYLRHTDYKYLPLTPLQQTKINSALGSRTNPNRYLSPKQQNWLKEIKVSSFKSKILMNTEFNEAWTFSEQHRPVTLSSN